MDPIDVAVEIPQVGDPRRKSWAKVVYGVDEDRSTGWAFEGEFIATGGVQDVPAGSVIVVYGEKGSRDNPQIESRVYTANADGTLSHHKTATGRAWARTLRDLVVDLLEEQHEAAPAPLEWGPELTGYSEEALREELRRRERDI